MSDSKSSAIQYCQGSTTLLNPPLHCAHARTHAHARTQIHTHNSISISPSRTALARPSMVQRTMVVAGAVAVGAAPFALRILVPMHADARSSKALDRASGSSSKATPPPQVVRRPRSRRRPAAAAAAAAAADARTTMRLRPPLCSPPRPSEPSLTSSSSSSSSNSSPRTFL